jgi:hypothetical protein
MTTTHPAIQDERDLLGQLGMSDALTEFSSDCRDKHRAGGNVEKLATVESFLSKQRKVRAKIIADLDANREKALGMQKVAKDQLTAAVADLERQLAERRAELSACETELAGMFGAYTAHPIYLASRDAMTADLSKPAAA